MKPLYYKKLRKKIFVDDFKNEGVVARYGEMRNDKFHGLEMAAYSHIPESVVQEFYSIIPEQHRDKFFPPLLMQINDYLEPHVDSASYGIKATGINLYIETDGAITTFHVPKEGAKKKAIKNAKEETHYSWEDTEVVDSFVAVKGDIYIVDTESYHSVTGPSEGAPRSILCISTSLSFDEVVDIIGDV